MNRIQSWSMPVLVLVSLSLPSCQSEQEIQQQQETARASQVTAQNAAAFDAKVKEVAAGREFSDLTKSANVEPFFLAWNSSEENPGVKNAMCPVGDEFAYQKSKPEFAKVRAIKYVLFSSSYDSDELNYNFADQKYSFKYTSFNFLGPEGGVLYTGCRPRQQGLHITQTQSLALAPAEAEELKKSIEVQYQDPRYRALGLGGTRSGSLVIYTFGEILEVKVVDEGRFPLLKSLGAFAVWQRRGQPMRFLPVN